MLEEPYANSALRTAHGGGALRRVAARAAALFPAGHMKATHVIGIALVVYAIFLPVALWVSRDYVPAPRPDGKMVEVMGTLYFDHPDHYFARLYIILPGRFPDPSKLAVYENLTRLSETNFTVDVSAYVVRFKASDGSDPRANGRNYWVVLP